MRRRRFLALAAAAAAPDIIDTHVHFYDPSRPQGVPWPPKDDALLYRTVMPAGFRRVAGPLGVTGVIVIEASSWLEDNQWLLDLAAKDSLIRGVVGNISPAAPEFRKNLDRFAANTLFRGIRLGPGALKRIDVSAFMANLEYLANKGLMIDVIGGPSILAAVDAIARRLPQLTVVIDHLPFDAPLSEYSSPLRDLRRHTQVFLKVSNVAPVPSLEFLWDAFGPSRLVYGSNWPVSDRVQPYDRLFANVRDYFSRKSAERHFFFENSRAAYRWTRG